MYSEIRSSGASSRDQKSASQRSENAYADIDAYLAQTRSTWRFRVALALYAAVIPHASRVLESSLLYDPITSSICRADLSPSEWHRVSAITLTFPASHHDHSSASSIDDSSICGRTICPKLRRMCGRVLSRNLCWSRFQRPIAALSFHTTYLSSSFITPWGSIQK